MPNGFSIQFFEDTVLPGIIASHTPRDIIILNDDLNGMTNDPDFNWWFDRVLTFKMYRILWPRIELNIIHATFGEFILHSQLNIDNMPNEPVIRQLWQNFLAGSTRIQDYWFELRTNILNVQMAQIEDEEAVHE